MPNIHTIIKQLKALDKAMHDNQCYTCHYEFVDLAHDFGTNIVGNAIMILDGILKNAMDKEQLPENCSQCEYYDGTCILSPGTLEGWREMGKRRPVWCPLEKKEEG